MRIYSNAIGTMKRIAQHHIRCLAPDARELHKRFHRVWHSAIMMLQEDRTTALNGLGFLTIKTGRLDILSKLLRSRCHIVSRRTVFLE